MKTNHKYTGTTLHNGRTWKRLIRIERAVQLQACGLYKDSEIALMIGITPQAFTFIKQTQEFQQRMITAKSGIIAQNDVAMKTDAEYQAAFIKEQVPVALSKIAQLIMSKNETIALKASAELLDRDGAHAKVSKSEIKVKDDKDRSHNDLTASNIMAILSGQAQYTEKESQSVEDIMKEFTKGAMDADKQIELTEATIGLDTLEDIGRAKSKPTIN